MKKKTVIIVILFALLATGIGIYLGTNNLKPVINKTQNINEPQSIKDLQKVSLRLAWVPDMAEAGIFIAKEKGFYSSLGLDVDIKNGGFGLDPFKLVASGTDIIGVGGAGNLILAREQGVPVVAIAAEFQNTPVGFIVKADSGIQNFKDFAGKRVGVQTGSDTDVLYRALLSYNKMTQNDVNEVPIQYDMKPFLVGQIDVLPGYVTNQPITLKNQGVNTYVITAISEGIDMYGNIYFVTEDTLRKNPKLINNFVKATLKGWSFFFENKTEAIEIVGKYVEGFSVTDLENIYNAVSKFIWPSQDVKILSMDIKRWESTYDVLKKAGISKNEINIINAFQQNN